jgi:hypothetical protein
MLDARPIVDHSPVRQTLSHLLVEAATLLPPEGNSVPALSQQNAGAGPPPPPPPPAEIARARARARARPRTLLLHSPEEARGSYLLFSLRTHPHRTCASFRCFSLRSDPHARTMR